MIFPIMQFRSYANDNSDNIQVNSFLDYDEIY